jgi:programmed cell death protein 5
MDELEALRARKLQQLQAQQNAHYQQEQQQQQQMQEMMRQVNALISQYLSPEARTRLANLEMVDPELVQKLKIYFAQMASSGQLKQMDDKQLKDILIKLKGANKREITIKRQ